MLGDACDESIGSRTTNRESEKDSGLCEVTLVKQTILCAMRAAEAVTQREDVIG